jgi:hypothetical protein
LAKVDYTSELNGNPLDTVYEVLNAISTNAGGTKGGDFIGGGAGRDVMSGGPGGDVFIFGLGDGNDVVLDFDADPAGGQDRLWITDALTLGKNADNDAVITLKDGSTLTLLGVRKSEIEDGDFYSPPEML